MMDLRKVSDEVLAAKLLELVSKERSLLCMIIICVMEIARRKSYLNTHPDLFSYLTDLLKYSHGSAQRRKDAALLALEVPSILEEVKSGSLNLSQITLAQSAFRLSERLKKKALKISSKKEGALSADVDFNAKLPDGDSKEDNYKVPIELKKEILTAIRDKSVAESEVIIYTMLNIKPKSRTKLTHQSDGSVRCETTHSKSQWQKIERTKELLSHSVPTGEMTDLMEYLCDRVIAFKNKTVPKQSRKQASSKAGTRKANGQENEKEIEKTVIEVYEMDNHKSANPAFSEIPSGIRKSANLGRPDGGEADARKGTYDNDGLNLHSKDRSRKFVTLSKLENFMGDIGDSTQWDGMSKTNAEISDGIGPGVFATIPHGIAQCPSPTRFVKPKSRSAISVAVQRQIFARDKHCQHVSTDGKICGSRWHLQIDHVRPVWAGGGDDVENLRLLCGAHNRAVYRRQSGVIAG